MIGRLLDKIAEFLTFDPDDGTDDLELKKDEP